MRPLAEFAIVFGASLLLLFVVVPAGTVETDNFGLSPRMLPMVCVTVIAAMSLVTLLFGLMRAGPAEDAPRGGLRGAIQLGAAALVGIVLVDQTGLVIGGTALVLLACLAVGERRIATLAGMGAGGLLILLLVDWSGL